MRALAFAFSLVLAPSALAAEKVVDLPTARGSTQRVLIDVPANLIGSVVLLAGGTGDLKIDEAGRVRGLYNNQLVRSRALYVAAGYAVAVPDIAADLKPTENYRGNPSHGRDIAALIAHMRAIKGPVALIGTSRGALSAANVMLKQTDALPDALVITSGVLLGSGSSAEAQGDPARIKVPVLLVGHSGDTCRVTPPSAIASYAARLTGARKVDTLMLSGGAPAKDDACEAQGPHGFFGMDQQVVDAITGWLKANMR
jgi:dienelactone hydrolase